VVALSAVTATASASVAPVEVTYLPVATSLSAIRSKPVELTTLPARSLIPSTAVTW